MFFVNIVLISLSNVEAGDILDDCNYQDGFSLCGDVCISDKYGTVCFCGEKEERLELWYKPKYCCVQQRDDNSTQCTIDDHGWGHCPQGRILNKTEICNGQCFNDYEASYSLGPDSQYKCRGHCVPVWKMCRGYSECEDFSDVTVCNDDLTCVSRRGEQGQGEVESVLSDQHRFCIYENYHNDGDYNTITREDETNLDIRTHRVTVDYNSLTECNSNSSGTSPVNNGLECRGQTGLECLTNFIWCREEYRYSCGNTGHKFNSDNRGLCSNTTFWRNKTCDLFYFDEMGKASLGKRCSGGMQHCINPWYFSGNFYYEVILRT